MLKVIVAFDGSEQATKAVECLPWFDRQGLEVTVVQAVDGPAIDEFGDAVDADPEAVRDAQADLAAFVARLREAGIAAQLRIVVGEAASAIVDLAGEIEADLIVTGSRGLGLARRMVLGSTSAAICARAACAVMIVR